MSVSEHSGTDDELRGRAIKTRRVKLGFSRALLAERAGLSYPYISEIENGKKEPSTRAQRQIANALGWELDELHRAIVELRHELELVEPLQAPVGGNVHEGVDPMPVVPTSFLTYSSSALSPAPSAEFRGIDPLALEDEVMRALEPALDSIRERVRRLVRNEIQRALTEAGVEDGRG